MDADFDDFPDDLLMQALESAEKQAPKAAATRPATTGDVHQKPPSLCVPPEGTSTSSGQPGPAKVQQPIPRRLPAQPSGAATATTPAKTIDTPSKIVQPKPQKLAKPSSGSAIVVSMRQKGNPVLTHFKKCAWEYGDILADYVLGVTTCALFLSLKYHRLHPEYIYKRIQDLQGKYELRVVLALVDIADHHDSLRELAKTSMVNNVTLICCWSVQEAAHYLETYKQMEHSNFSAIKGQQGSNYVERVLSFVTAVPGLNRTEALSLITNFGSLRGGINADVERLSMIGGWGDIKVKRWLDVVDEPFRARKASKLDILSVPGRSGSGNGSAQGNSTPAARATATGPEKAVPGETVAAAAAAAKVTMTEPSASSSTEEQPQTTAQNKDLDPPLSSGVSAALARLRESS
ncbi:Mating-type switching protein swi10 [Ceratocystis fimbriata CBS 114723]|uniref:Mating-type switching protein swi10 n=1 Tax=Ceratocystis fimbriata CBS 114723 TaxID=1035309 RepID=A0A2C5XF45_9PEZI|nr:Mating-type switching protein swi10 [Ceratocystis fimbriata CBS 114723]